MESLYPPLDLKWFSHCMYPPSIHLAINTQILAILMLISAQLTYITGMITRTIVVLLGISFLVQTFRYHRCTKVKKFGKRGIALLGKVLWNALIQHLVHTGINDTHVHAHTHIHTHAGAVAIRALPKAHICHADV